MIGWTVDDEVVWRFNYDQSYGKPHFHPLRIPGGPELTACAPADHPWHYGLWFSWKYVNGLNYWEEDPSTNRAEGRMVWSEPVVERTSDDGIIIRIQIEYRHSSGRLDLAEYRDLVVSPVERNGKYSITWTSHFTAGEEGVTLDRTPLPSEPNGRLWGGYAGLSLRLSSGDEPAAFLNSKGTLEGFEEDRLRPEGQSLGVTVFPSQRHSGSIAVLADPRNFEGSHPWYLINGQPSRFVCAAVLAPGPRRLGPGEVWELSYRVLVRPRAWNSDDLEEEMRRWLSR